MKAVAYYRNLPIEAPDALLDIELPDPEPGPRDLLVEVAAVSVNPVDVKVRAGMAPPEGSAKVLGWDAAGVVRAVGRDVTLFQPGDRVWYAGDLQRPGSNAEWQAVDERLVGHMPRSLDFAAAAALPLTSITAWELLFDRLQIAEGAASNGQSLLIVGAAGGVGSIMLQLARQLTGVTVIGTASRPETAAWVRELGAHHVIDHSQPLAEQLRRQGIEYVDFVAGLNQTDRHLDQIVEALRPQGRLALIDDPESLDVRLLKRKSLSLHWEFMYTRSLYATEDMIEQHRLLARVAELVDAGTLKSTLTEKFGRIVAADLKRAHAFIERNQARGKVVLAGF
ncbi:zinc-binding alcohol dehydrogenase family protein [Paludibacterium purpuratum]|uniref:Zinc-type alcohol dehydrogenase-like protein n=1 Tax=Paludibacterium purpuratum TaxID=1144873 RepID=A0A4R7AZP0_9NEIS|nr:zinc-binding alcohol dehydrogenase family protein [Paludibacterium purpuratum]TDR73292.1 zinc-binding alcohol dehydrogenase family protein [Paludibacterium purpuratum]